MRTDESDYGKGTFENQNYLYRNDKSYENCCTLGDETVTISALRFCILSVDISFLAETLYQKGLQGLNFHLTLQNVMRYKETIMGFKFFQPKKLEDALLYKRDMPNSILVAGATDVIPQMRKEKVKLNHIIDLSKIESLKIIESDCNQINVGALVTFTSLEESTLLKKFVRIICNAAHHVGSPQIRNRGTIGGNLCNASPSADIVPPLVCLDAEVSLLSIDASDRVNTRFIPVEKFITEYHKTQLTDTEILTGVNFSVPPKNALNAFKKIGRRNAVTKARLNGACILSLYNDKILNAQIALGSVTEKPLRLYTAEKYLMSKKLDYYALASTGEIASKTVFNLSGNRGSSSYKIPVIKEFIIDLIESAT